MKHPYFRLGCLILLSATACKQDREIKVYRVAREAAPAPENPSASPDPHAGMAGGAPADPHAGFAPDPATAAANNTPKFADNPPEHWKKQALSSLRLASYLIEGDGGAMADVSLSVLRRAEGGLLANVNRWREQLGQAAIDEATLKQASQTINTTFGEGTVVDIEGTAPEPDAAKDGRIVGVIAESGNEAWFFKMRGNAALTKVEKEGFFKWVGSVKPLTEPAATAATTAPPAANVTVSPTVPATPATPAIPPPAPAGNVTWQLPDGWKQASAAGAMRYATITLGAADGATAELAVSHFPGDVGGDLENVNRWRQQVAMEPVDAAALAAQITKLTAGPQTLSLIDVTGPKQRLIAGWTRHGADTWFFKLTGPDALLGTEKAKFTAFLESIRFNPSE